MAEKKKVTLFGPIPLRAFSDQRLTELHLRTLGIIAYHDRMSLVVGAGQGCWASSATMAEEMGGYNIANVSTAISQLEKWGYLQIEKRPADKRMRVYRVIFEPSGNLPPGQTIDADESGDRLPKGKEPPKVVCPPDRINDWNTEETSPQYISQSEERDFAEATKIDSAEAAHFADREKRGEGIWLDNWIPSKFKKDDAEASAARGWALQPHLPPNFMKLPPGAKLQRFEEAFELIGRDANRMHSRERTAFAELLLGIAESSMGENDAVANQAHRLWEELLEF